jgi:hypothetical protein
LEDLQNTVMDILRRKGGNYSIRRSMIEYVYENAREGSTIRKFVADRFGFDFITGIFRPQVEAFYPNLTEKYFKTRVDIESMIEENGRSRLRLFEP